MVQHVCMQCPGFSQNVQDGFVLHLQVLKFPPGAANIMKSVLCHSTHANYKSRPEPS